MTRSDIFLAVAKHEPDDLLRALHAKIENVYHVLFVLEEEKNEVFHTLAETIRKALES